MAPKCTYFPARQIQIAYYLSQDTVRQAIVCGSIKSQPSKFRVVWKQCSEMWNLPDIILWVGWSHTKVANRVTSSSCGWKPLKVGCLLCCLRGCLGNGLGNVVTRNGLAREWVGKLGATWDQLWYGGKLEKIIVITEIFFFLKNFVL